MASKPVGNIDGNIHTGLILFICNVEIIRREGRAFTMGMEYKWNIIGKSTLVSSVALKIDDIINIKLML